MDRKEEGSHLDSLTALIGKIPKTQLEHVKQIRTQAPPGFEPGQLGQNVIALLFAPPPPLPRKGLLPLFL